MQISKLNICGSVIVLSVVGFPFAAALAQITGISSTILSILIRSLIIIYAFLIFLHTKNISKSILFFFFSLFWFIYSTKLIIFLIFDLQDLYHPDYFYLLFAFGTTLIPALSVYLSIEPTQLKKIIYRILYISTFVVLVSLVFGSRLYYNEFGVAVDNRLNLKSLNPISLGHVAVSNIIICLSIIRYENLSRQKSFLFLVLLGISGWCLILTNSRGPLLVLLLLGCLLVFRESKNIVQFSKKLLVLFVAIGLVLFLLIASSMTENLLNRITAINASQLATLGRIISFLGAFEQFVSSPIWGDGIEERVTGLYPHNTVLEAFMATGIIGGIPFLIIVTWAMTKKFQNDLNPFGVKTTVLLGQQYVLASMFSGAIYASHAMWVLLVILISPKIWQSH